MLNFKPEQYSRIGNGEQRMLTLSFVLYVGDKGREKAELGGISWKVTTSMRKPGSLVKEWQKKESEKDRRYRKVS